MTEGGKAKLCAGEAFPPVVPVRAYDGGNRIFINQGLVYEDIPVSGTILIRLGNGGHYRQWYLGIGDNGRKQKGVGMAAVLAEDAGDLKQEEGIPLSESAGITTVPDQTAEMAAGTGKHS